MTLTTTAVEIPVESAALKGDLNIPDSALGLVIFAHGSGSSRKSGRNRQVASQLNAAGLATLLFDLLTEAEEQVDLRTRHLRFDIPLLGTRLTAAVDWARQKDQNSENGATAALPVGLFGASTGAAAALMAAADRADAVRAVVSRGGRPDLAGDKLRLVRAPTLLIVGSLDTEVIALNRQAAAKLTCDHHVEIVPGASHLFEEPGKLDAVARLTIDWFTRKLS